MRKNTNRALLSALLTVLFASNTWAEDSKTEADGSKTEAESISTRDTVTGDWGGSRSDLVSRGVKFDFRLSQYYQGVTSGGVDTNSEYGGTMDYRLNIDAGKLFGANGWSLDMHARTRFGSDINADAGAFVLPNAGMMMPVPGGYHGTDITGLTASYMFPLNEAYLGNITFGKLDV